MLYCRSYMYVRLFHKSPKWDEFILGSCCRKSTHQHNRAMVALEWMLVTRITSWQQNKLSIIPDYMCLNLVNITALYVYIIHTLRYISLTCIREAQGKYFVRWSFWNHMKYIYTSIFASILQLRMMGMHGILLQMKKYNGIYREHR
jgi:hypothetical protein